MELKYLNTFLKISEVKNFTKAANALGYSQSAVTTQIRQIEEELGVPVFDRLGKSISLTEAGKKLHHYARIMLMLEEQALNEIKEQADIAGELKMAIDESLAISFLPDILHYFRSQHPNVDLIVKTTESSAILPLLKSNEVDLVYTLDNLHNLPELIRPRELAEPIHFIAPTIHPLCQKENITLEDLLPEPFILTESGSSYRTELEKQLSRRNLTLHPFLEVHNTDIICRLVSKGVGLSFVPDCISKPYVEDGLLSYLEIPEISIKMYRQMLYYRDKWQTPQMKAMIRLLHEIDFH